MQIEIDAGHRPIGFTGEGVPHIVRPFVPVAINENDGQHEFVHLVESVEDFIAGDGDGALPLGSALHFDVAGR